jgi:hypothetical protein
MEPIIGSFRKTAGIQKKRKKKGDIILQSVLIWLIIIIPAWNLGSVLQRLHHYPDHFAQKDSQMKTKDVRICGGSKNFLHLLLLYLEFEQHD